MHTARLHRLERRLEQRRRIRKRRRVAGAIAILAVAIPLLVALWPSSRAKPAHTELKPATDTSRHLHGSRAGAPRPTLSVGNSPPQTLPFAPNPNDRATRPGEVPSLYADGLSCSTGCRSYGAQIGWPLEPFHQQHPLRAGLNELRPRSLHVGLDIQASDGAAVYAVQPGVAHVLAPSGPNARVQVGNYVYWHITPAVSTGQRVSPFKTVIGKVMSGYGHIAFSELDSTSNYVNPLRPGGRVLEPYVDRAPPEIAQPAVAAGGQVVVSAYDPQTFVQRTTYITPVLAPAALAYRLYDSRGTPVTPLEWAFRGAHLLPWRGHSLIFGPGAGAPGFACFAQHSVCVPHWLYRVAGGLTPPLPPTVAPGSYRLTIYAWDWADNKTALDTSVTMTPSGWKPIGSFPSVLFHTPGYFLQRQLLGSSQLPQASAKP